MLQLKRAYEKPSKKDGFRVLVERLWPRGINKARAAIDLWLKDVAPSTELRRWYGHDPSKWKEFRNRYRAELRDHPAAVKLLKQKSRQGSVTLVYATKDKEHSGALVLKEFLEGGPN